jgi:hypothetical protein
MKYGVTVRWTIKAFKIFKVFLELKKMTTNSDFGLF